jgi:transposase-like protein
MRRVPSVDALIPALYLKGIPTGDFSEALTAILGEGASGLSATNIVRLKSGWETDYKALIQRDLSAKRYVYWWADGVYFNVRFDEERTCVLVLIGATEDGREVLFTFYDFPAQHWPHLRTTNPIESTFATVRLRTHRTKGCGSRIATLTMVFKLGLEAQKHWRRLQGFELIPKVATGVRFVDGEEQSQQAA